MDKIVAHPLKREFTEPAVPCTLKQALARKNACSVLITCQEPEEDGKMQVEMMYEGDACLAAYLIESAQALLENDAHS
jgi:hypothetical protein